MLTTFIISTILSLALIGAGFFYLKRMMLGPVGSQRETAADAIKTLDKEILGFKQYMNSYSGTGQFDSVVAMLEDFRRQIETEKEQLKQLEEKLEGSQQHVEGKEASQQELKAARDADEKALDELLASYESIAAESVALEAQLAASLKNLDHMFEELETTDEQKQMLEYVQEALTNASALLRDLMTEYDSMQERLNLLKEQHTDLEDEYTRLVEQQLGE